MASNAAVVTLVGTSGSTCSYSTMSITPDGNVAVTCASTGPVTSGDAGIFSFASASAPNVNIGDVPALTIVRSTGTTGAVSVPYSVSGGCSGGGAANFADGQASLAVTATATAAGSCTLTLGTPTTGAAVSVGPRTGGTTSVSFGVNSPAGGGGGAPGCAAPPSDMVTANFKSIGAVLLQMQKSNQVVSIPLPDVASGSHSGQVVFSESAGGAFTPQPVTLNISISKCPGIIDTDPNNSCNLSNTNGNYNAMTWFASPYSVIQDAASAARYSFCWAPRSEGQWYVNARWTYSSCAFGAAVCGFAVQQNYGSW